MKQCARCGSQLPRDKFYARTDTGKLGSWCKDCIRKANRARFLAPGGKERQKAAIRRFRYGLSQAEIDALIDEQDGLCAICRREPGRKALHIDHDHSTGRVRGLLCVSCNMGLGQFQDSDDLLMRAITYLHHGFIPA